MKLNPSSHLSQHVRLIPKLLASAAHGPIQKVAQPAVPSYRMRLVQLDLDLHFRPPHLISPLLSSPLLHAKMRTPFTALSLLALFPSISASLQFCKRDAAKETDLCLAVASSHNASTHVNDVSLHLSVRFSAPATGWAAVGVGEQMKGALMFVLYPGLEDDCKMTSALSFPIRSLLLDSSLRLHVE